MEKELYSGAIKLRDKLTRALLKMDLEEPEVLMDLVCTSAAFEANCLKFMQERSQRERAEAYHRELKALGFRGAEVTG